MKYIPKLDPQLVPPPYRLGTDNESYRFEAHHLLLLSTHDELQRIVNAQLNIALWDGLDEAQLAAALAATAADQIPYGPAILHTSLGDVGPKNIRYVVPTNVQFVRLSFVRYWRADSAMLSNEGFSGYTECLVHFVVRRDVEDEGTAPESLRFIGIVYIDDRGYAGPQQDPQSLPIMLGREAFGLPKGPGQIYYCPHPGNPRSPGNPILRVWENLPGQYLTPERAIYFNTSTEPKGDCDFTPPSSDTVQDDAAVPRYSLLAEEFNISEDEFKDRIKPEPGLGPSALNFVTPSDEIIVLYSDLYLYMRLVGLHQFPDPTSAFDAGSGTVDACYRAIVESPIEEHGNDRTQWYTMSGAQKLYFPEQLNRIQLIDVFDLQGAISDGTNRVITVPESSGKYVWGNMLYARPARVNVWYPTPPAPPASPAT